MRAPLLLALVLSGCAAGDPVDPTRMVRSVVATVAADHGWSVNYPKQRKLFRIHGRFWLFYSDGRDAVLRTSADGRTWSEPSRVHPGGHYGHRDSFAFDGRYLHLAHCAAGANEPVVYRRGEPRPDGTIDWSAPPQRVFAVRSGGNVMYPKVIVDDGGHPWVAFVHCRGGPHEAPYDAVVIRSAARDGRWATAEGFPHRLVKDIEGNYPDPVGAALTGGKVGWLVNGAPGTRYQAHLWDGRWAPAEQLSQGPSTYGLLNAVAEGDALHAVYRAGALRYRKRGADGRWGPELTVSRRAGGHATITLAGPDRVLIGWPERRALAFREVAAGAPGPVRQLLASEQPMAGWARTRGINHNALQTAVDGYDLAVAYTTGEARPFTLRFAALRSRPQPRED